MEAEAASSGVRQPPHSQAEDRTPEQRKSSKATPKQNKNVHRANKQLHSKHGQHRQPHVKCRVRKVVRQQVKRSRLAQGLAAEVRVLDMENLTMCVCPFNPGLQSI